MKAEDRTHLQRDGKMLLVGGCCYEAGFLQQPDSLVKVGLLWYLLRNETAVLFRIQ